MNKKVVYLIGALVGIILINILFTVNMGGDVTALDRIAPTIVGTIVGILISNSYLLIQTTKALKEEKQKVVEATQMKSAFLANMSHEIRTPMNAILGFTTVLEETKLSERQVVALQAITNSTKTLKTIIDDVLDFSKIESGKMSILSEPFDLKASCEEIVKTFEHQAEKKGIALNFDYDEVIKSVTLDEVRVRQIIINLLSNAIKFTSTGSVTLQVKAKLIDERDSALKILVSDTGIGIKEEDKAGILSPYTQSVGQSVKQFGGTGLGLSISNQLAKLMGGELSIEDNKPTGAIFVLSFDSVVVNEKVQKSRECCVDMPSLQDKTILLVDDIANNRLLLNIKFEDTGVHLIEAVNGKDAIEKYQEHLPDLILMDIKMPVMDGLEATKYLRENFEHLPPIVALSADAMDANSEKYKIFDHFLAKPIVFDELAKSLKRYLG